MGTRSNGWRGGGARAGRVLIAALAVSVWADAARAEEDLPHFDGDGFRYDQPALTTTFTLDRGFNAAAQPGRDGPDQASLETALAIQGEVTARLAPETRYRLEGVARPVSGADLVGTVAALRQWQGSGQPLTAFVTPYLLRGEGHGNVRFTGYLTPSLPVSATASPAYPVPIYRKPADQPGPYPSRHDIDAGALVGQGLELAWTTSRAELFFLQVQGSGYGFYPDGRRQLFSFAGKNGHPYVSIGKHLVNSGEIAADQISLASIKAWFAAHPDRADQVMELNPSYVFFATDRDAVTGATGRPVTALRSVAADTTILPLGAMILIEMPIIGDDGKLLRYEPRVMAVQDRGGAIKGSGRIDIYAGGGMAAETLVGGLKHFGRVWLLLPRAG